MMSCLGSRIGAVRSPLRHSTMSSYKAVRILVVTALAGAPCFSGVHAHGSGHSSVAARRIR
jgi:hypothetical protein